ncbi:CAP domain [Phytophthora cactorum]|nr:CAP domain [Phytophthora cactorum]
MLACVNKERAAEGLPPVCGNKKLQSSSQRHSDDMAQNNYMAHEAPMALRCRNVSLTRATSGRCR